VIVEFLKQVLSVCAMTFRMNVVHITCHLEEFKLKLAASNLIHSLGLPRPTIKLHPEEMWAWPLASEAPKYLGFLFSISATAAMSS